MMIEKAVLGGRCGSRTADIFRFLFAVSPERMGIHSRSPRFRHQSQPVTPGSVFTPTPTLLTQAQGAILQGVSTLTELDVPYF
jgi:hypothetical protein